MSCPGVGPCDPWPLTLCCLDDAGALEDKCTLNGQPVPAAIVASAKLAASQLMWALTGRQFGQCTATIRPCRRRDCDDAQWSGLLPSSGGAYGFQPALIGGEWFNVACGCPTACCCKACEIDIPYPTCSVSEVKIDGAVIPANQYRIDDFRKLVRVGSSTNLQSCSVVPSLHASTFPFAAGAVCDLTPAPTATSGFPSQVGTCFEGSGVADFPSVPQIGFTVKDGTVVPQAGFNNFAITAPQWNTTTNPCSDCIIWPVHPAPYSAGDVIQSLPDADGRVATMTIVSVIGTGPHVDNPNNNPQTWTVDSGSEVEFTVAFACPVPKGECWPTCQNMDLPDTEPDTWSVTLKYGRDIPELVLLAAADLACELIKACTNQPCRLPQRLASVARQGVTMNFIDSMSMLDKGRIGLFLADTAIMAFNPGGLSRRPAVWSPDAEQWRTTTG